MKLELHHLAPYLPYGLSLFYEDTKRKYPLVVHNPTVSIRGGFNINEVINEPLIKPILRPISDLGKYGTEFSVYNLNVLLEQAGYTRLTVDQYGGKIDIEIEPKEESASTQYLNFEPMQIITEFFYTHHYDVFGLIEQCLAIDINTLRQ